VATEVIKGIARGCELAGCALAGGETAEHPQAFIPGEYDLAGFAVGVVEKSQAIDGTTISSGDVLLGLASSGPHSNGFSLIRRILEVARADLHLRLPASGDPATLGEMLLAPTRIYVKPVLALLRSVAVKGMAHITGGGLLENVHRMFPPDKVAAIDGAAWPRPPVFAWLQRAGNVEEREMQRTFNCGIGMVLVVAAGEAELAQALLRQAGETVYRIGTVRERVGDEAQTQLT
jgi:phosphoribosylformylglycinamidine cyclo-ligase